MVSEDDCEDRDNRQPRHQARGSVSAGQVRAPHYHHEIMRYIGTYLRGIITSLSEDTICIRSRELFLFNFSQFLQIAVISCFRITVKIDHNDDSQNVLAKHPLTARCSRLFTRQEVVVLPPLVHPLIFCRSFLGSLHPSLRCSLL